MFRLRAITGGLRRGSVKMYNSRHQVRATSYDLVQCPAFNDGEQSQSSDVNDTQKPVEIKVYYYHANNCMPHMAIGVDGHYLSVQAKTIYTPITVVSQVDMDCTSLADDLAEHEKPPEVYVFHVTPEVAEQVIHAIDTFKRGAEVGLREYHLCTKLPSIQSVTNAIVVASAIKGNNTSMGQLASLLLETILPKASVQVDNCTTAVADILQIADIETVSSNFGLSPWDQGPISMASQLKDHPDLVEVRVLPAKENAKTPEEESEERYSEMMNNNASLF